MEIFPRKFSDKIFLKSGHVYLPDGVVTYYDYLPYMESTWLNQDGIQWFID